MNGLNKMRCTVVPCEKHLDKVGQKVSLFHEHTPFLDLILKRHHLQGCQSKWSCHRNASPFLA